MEAVMIEKYPNKLLLNERNEKGRGGVVRISATRVSWFDTLNCIIQNFLIPNTYHTWPLDQHFLLSMELVHEFSNSIVILHSWWWFDNNQKLDMKIYDIYLYYFVFVSNLILTVLTYCVPLGEFVTMTKSISQLYVLE